MFWTDFECMWYVGYSQCAKHRMVGRCDERTTDYQCGIVEVFRNNFNTLRSNGIGAEEYFQWISLPFEH